MISSNKLEFDGPIRVERSSVWEVQAINAEFQSHSPASPFEAGNQDELINAAPGINPIVGESENAEHELADAYSRGVVDGEARQRQAASKEREDTKRLTKAIEELRPQSDAELSTLILKSVQGLLLQAIGKTEPDADFLRQRAETLSKFIHDGMKSATLHIHPDDLDLLGAFECGVTIATDPVLLRGTLRLVHSEGCVEQGGRPLLDEMQILLEEMEQHA